MYDSGYARAQENEPSSPAPKKPYKASSTSWTYMGLDGEGVRGHSLEEPNHHYILLAAVTEHGQRYWVEDPDGLSTEACLRFIIGLPKSKHRLFGYSLGYDWTKILQDVDDQRLYLLFRPELRKRKDKKGRKGPRPIEWRGFSLNLQGTKFTVEYGGQKVVIWDIWKFYQSKFVGALKDWKVGTKELWTRMEAMKAQRATFQLSQMPEIRAYCFEECQCMAQLAHALVSAHDKAELKLTSFYGAGSSATALLKKFGIREKIKPLPAEMDDAVSRSFFGGRFENSVIGEISDVVYNYDISSAYPYQCCQLPCLIHGTWHPSDDREELDEARCALVHYGLEPSAAPDAWGPFPYRDDDGNISFPATGPGGWVWGDEFLAGEAAFPGLVRFREAWVYTTTCSCKPFEEVPHYYRERVRIGKEGPGIVYKLALNSVYGKTAQSIGNALFQCWAWAGLITSGCRAQALRLFPMFRSLSDILMIATDGLVARHRIETPVPLDTGTYECRNKDGNLVPLGGWEESVMDNGIFLARPGIYYPLTPTEKDLKKVKGRGVGKGVVLKNHGLISASWRQHRDAEKVSVYGIERFCGAKTSISYSPASGKFTRAAGGWEPAYWDEARQVMVPPRRVKPAYGEWIDRTVVMSFNPMPKREAIEAVKRGSFSKLSLRRIPMSAAESVPYKKIRVSAEAAELRAAKEEIEEQPDLDYLESFMHDFYGDSYGEAAFDS